MSVIIQYSSSKDSQTNLDFGTRSGRVQLRQAINLDPNKGKGFRVIKVMVSGQIPNIFNYNGQDNTKINVSKDAGLTWDTIQMQNGIYTVQMLQLAIRNGLLLLGYVANVTDASITLSYNVATQYVYVTLDSTKLLLPGQLGIDFSVSQIYQALGYTFGASTFIVDGAFSATNPPLLDVQGNYLEIVTNICQGCRWSGSNISNVLCRVPIIATDNEIIFPAGSTGFVSPLTRASIPSTISAYDVNILNERGQETVFMFGGFSLELELVDL